MSASTITSETGRERRTGLVPIPNQREAALRTAIELWASSSTSATTRRHDELVQKKRKTVQSFFDEAGCDPGDATPQNVHDWCARMKREDGWRPAPATVYARFLPLIVLRLGRNGN